MLLCEPLLPQTVIHAELQAWVKTEREEKYIYKKFHLQSLSGLDILYRKTPILSLKNASFLPTRLQYIFHSVQGL
jgi:hypothetical protein